MKEVFQSKGGDSARQFVVNCPALSRTIWMVASIPTPRVTLAAQTKAAANIKKHGVSFDEAQSVFYDEFAVQFFDEDHSTAEERFLMLGMSADARLLLVCHCEREAGSVIRIISARKATKREQAFYGGDQR